MAKGVIAIDVSGAPAHVRRAIGFAFKVMLALVLAIVLSLPLTILDMDSPVSHEIRQLGTLAAFAAAMFAVFGIPTLIARRMEREIELKPYVVTLAQAKLRVFARLHRRWWAHPDFWALVNLVLAFSVPIAGALNEHAIEAGLGVTDNHPIYWNSVIEGIDLVLGLVFILNAARLYKRGLSLWAFSVPMLVWFVLLPGLFLLYLLGASKIASLGAANAAPADHHAVLYIFVLFPALLLSFASLTRSVRLFYERIWRRFARLMEVVQLPSAARALARDRRKPVLYLRSFHVDEAWLRDGLQRLEDSVAAPLKELGPFIGIGRPGELAMSGAARAYYSDDAWQSAVTDLMARAGFIVLVMGATENLAWEIATIRASGHTAKVIWVLPPDQINGALLRQKVRDAFARTAYETAVEGADLSHAMAVHAVGADQLAVISSAKNTTGEYEAAIYAAVYGMTRHLIGAADRQPSSP